MNQPRSLFASFPTLLLALGIGLCGYYGHAWYQLEDYSETDIAASVELNLQLDLQRRGPHLQPDAAGLARLRQMVRTEVEADIHRERDSVQLRFGIGLIALVLGAGQLVAARLLT